MYMKDRQSGDLVEILNVQELIDPCKAEIHGRFHVGEELQDEAVFDKKQLQFPSDEPMPLCWLDPDYKGKAH